MLTDEQFEKFKSNFNRLRGYTLTLEQYRYLRAVIDPQVKQEDYMKHVNGSGREDQLCKEAVFHFNKGHLADPTIPMWVIKAKGQTFYVDHVDAQIGFSTKETPDNNHTKGSLKFKNCLISIDDGVATITRGE